MCIQIPEKYFVHSFNTKTPNSILIISKNNLNEYKNMIHKFGKNKNKINENIIGIDLTGLNVRGEKTHAKTWIINGKKMQKKILLDTELYLWNLPDNFKITLEKCIKNGKNMLI
jgi:hypothetical protein